MSSRFSNQKFGFLLVAGLAPIVAHSEVYLNDDQAVASIFPVSKTSGKFVRKTFELTKEEMKKIEDASGEKVRNASLVVWVNPNKDAVYIDQALGKHEFITYAVGIDAGKKVKGIEIMEYRETYGQDVRKLEWRKQFVGKDTTSPLKLKNDIVNISGATLSSAHITGGVRRMIQTHEIIRARL